VSTEASRVKEICSLSLYSLQARPTQRKLDARAYRGQLLHAGRTGVAVIT